MRRGERYRHYKGQVYDIVGDGAIVNKDELLTIEEEGKTIETVTQEAKYENTMETMTVIRYTDKNSTWLVCYFNEPTDFMEFHNVICYHNPELNQYWVRTVRDFTSLVEGDDIPVGTRRFTRVDHDERR